MDSEENGKQMSAEFEAKFTLALLCGFVLLGIQIKRLNLVEQVVEILPPRILASAIGLAGIIICFGLLMNKYSPPQSIVRGLISPNDTEIIAEFQSEDYNGEILLSNNSDATTAKLRLVIDGSVVCVCDEPLNASFRPIRLSDKVEGMDDLGNWIVSIRRQPNKKIQYRVKSPIGDFELRKSNSIK